MHPFAEHPFALIDAIQGRVEDVLSFPGEAFGVVNVHPLVFSRVMDTLLVSGKFHQAWVILPGKKGTDEHILYGKSGAALQCALAHVQ